MDLFATVFFLETKGSWWFVVFSQTSLNILGTGFRCNGLWSFSVPISFSISWGINVTSAFCSFTLWLWKSHQVGGYWDKSCSTVTQLKEGLNRILCLIPYNVISQSVWECIMPEWLEAIRTEVPDNQLKEFREVLRWVSSLMKSL